ncbi:MAG: MBL fold metallo-hydrolase [Clostridia bacterium]|nr:MBL fold metallo-hydrolase [Clostridia bacterium]
MNRRFSQVSALLLLILLCSLCSCSSKLAAPEHTAEETATQALAERKETDPTAEIEPDLLYQCADDSVLSTYKKRTQEDFENACAHFEKQGYTLYSALENSGVSAKTYTKGSALAHLYYHPVNKELNLVRSPTAADFLPPATPSGTEGNIPCTVTQLDQHPVEFNGMGYVIQLTDGSFILYDGGYSESADELLDTLQSLSPNQKPLIRAWVMTHLHGDHTGVFKRLAARTNATELFTLEYVICSPVLESNPGIAAEEREGRIKSLQKAVAKFPETRLIYAHTGMNFTFCNLKMEILYAPESLYKNLRAPEAFNNTSILSRLKDETGSMLFTGDIDTLGAGLSARLYGSDLASDMVQMSHHGMNGPLSFYETVCAATLWYPCSTSFYERGTNKPMRDALEKSPNTREIIIAGDGRATRPFPGS